MIFGLGKHAHRREQCSLSSVVARMHARTAARGLHHRRARKRRRHPVLRIACVVALNLAFVVVHRYITCPPPPLPVKTLRCDARVHQHAPRTEPSWGMHSAAKD